MHMLSGKNVDETLPLMRSELITCMNLYPLIMSQMSVMPSLNDEFLFYQALIVYGLRDIFIF